MNNTSHNNVVSESNSLSVIGDLSSDIDKFVKHTQGLPDKSLVKQKADELISNIKDRINNSSFLDFFKVKKLKDIIDEETLPGGKINSKLAIVKIWNHLRGNY